MSDLKYDFDEGISSPVELSYRKYLVKVCMVVALPMISTTSWQLSWAIPP